MQAPASLFELLVPIFVRHRLIIRTKPLVTERSAALPPSGKGLHVHSQAISCESGRIYGIAENGELACRNPRLSEARTELPHAGRKRRMDGRQSRKNKQSECRRKLVWLRHPRAARGAYARTPGGRRRNAVDCDPDKDAAALR